VLQCVAVCCSVLQCVAVCCSVLQCGAMWCGVVYCSVIHCSGYTIQTATHYCNTLRLYKLQHTLYKLHHTADTLYKLQHTTTLQHTTKHCNTLQHPATPCNTLQHTSSSRRIVNLSVNKTTQASITTATPPFLALKKNPHSQYTTHLKYREPL